MSLIKDVRENLRQSVSCFSNIESENEHANTTEMSTTMVLKKNLSNSTALTALNDKYWYYSIRFIRF